MLSGKDYCYPKGEYDDVNPKGGHGDEPLVTNPERSDYNAPDKSITFINYIQEQAFLYKSSHIMIPMGCDFTYENAGANYKDMEAQIKYIKENYKEANLDIFFSTPSAYISKIKSQKFSVYTGDLISYSEGEKNEVLSGYYSSRPGLKKNIRYSSSLLHSQNKLFSKWALNRHAKDSEIKNIVKASQQGLDILGVLNEHNSITGGVQEDVIKDNEERLVETLAASSKIYN